MTTVRPRAPDRLIQHEPHTLVRPSGYDSKPDWVSCHGRSLVRGCPIGEERERVYLEGFLDGVKSTSGYDVDAIRPIRTGPKPGEPDPFPEDTGDLQEHGRQVLAWYERHPEVCKDPPENPPEPASPKPEPDSLREWWIRTATEDIDRSISKIQEYGALDLELIGYALARMLKRDVSNRGELERLGIWFYELGKVARAISAIGAGGLPSADTSLDTAFYAMMDRRADESGGWP